MRYSLLFVLALVLISGFIAYFGDILGRRMGRRRLTLFNLRPRYTAIVVTTITGMLISGLAVLALISVNSEFRKVLTEGERIFTQNKRLSARNTSLARSNRDLLERRRELLRLVRERQRELDEARKKVQEAEQARNTAIKAISHLEADIAERKKTIDLLQGRKLEVDTALEVRTEELRALQAKLQKAQAGYQEVQARYIDVQARYTKAANDLEAARSSVRSAQKSLDDTQAKLLQVQSTLLNRTKELFETEKQLKSEKIKRIEAEALKSQFEQQFFGGNLILRQGDEMGRGVISPDQPAFGVRADLVTLLDRVGEAAAKRGARLGANGRAVNLVFRLPDGRVSEELTESKCLDYARDAITTSRTGALVQVLCARNTVADEQAMVEFVLYPNSLVFRKGDPIAETKLDGRFSEGRVLLSVISFLQGPVSEAALKHGIVPVANYDPRQTLGVNPQKQLDALLDVVDQIRSKRSKVDVTAYACSDIYAAGPVNMNNLRFSVTKTE
jgi:uncharacterized protein (DUF3084 family)